jgi:hypothetical protein
MRLKERNCDGGCVRRRSWWGTAHQWRGGEGVGHEPRAVFQVKREPAEQAWLSMEEAARQRHAAENN